MKPYFGMRLSNRDYATGFAGNRATMLGCVVAPALTLLALRSRCGMEVIVYLQSAYRM